MKDRLGTIRDRLGGLAGRGEIGGDGLDLCLDVVRLGRGNDVEQPHLLDRLAGEHAVLAESLGELSADHPGCAGDQDMHFAAPLLTYGRPAACVPFSSPRLTFCLPFASKFSGASQRSKAALRLSHSQSSIE